MALVLALFGISLVLTVVSAFLLSALMTPAESSPPVLEISHHAGTPRFFETGIPLSVSAASASRVPIDLLLLEIERHVRIERAVAESFHRAPTTQSLHVPAASPLMH